MRNKFEIILPDDQKFKPKKSQIVLMTSEGVLLIAEDCGYSGWFLRRLSEVVPKYDVRFLAAQDKLAVE
jgi:hypothetical protein